MVQPVFSREQIYKIGKENYDMMAKRCEKLEQLGYWEQANQLLHKSIHEMLDLYVQSVLIRLAVFCHQFNDSTCDFIVSLPMQNAIGLNITEESKRTISIQADKLLQSPPIILQLSSLCDYEQQTKETCQFYNSMINIMMVFCYLFQRQSQLETKFISDYYTSSIRFVNQDIRDNYLNQRYFFRKMSNQVIDDCCRELPKISREKKPQNRKSLTSMTEEIVKETINEEKTIEKVMEQSSNQQLEDLIRELNQLIGLDEVKYQVNSLINLIKVRTMRAERNLPTLDMTYHMVFTGNPGTGKTTVARLIAQIYKELGVLSNGNLVETDRSGLVAGYVGQTALKVKEVIEKALGGVLFIDEAYSLTSSVGNNDFGSEAIDTLVKMMEDHREDLVVIVAGYHDEMEQFLNSNTGLISRFNKFIEFQDYTPDELIAILQSMASQAGFAVEDSVCDVIKQSVSKLTSEEKRRFGNGRGIRNIFETLVMNQANRVVLEENPSIATLSTIQLCDVKNITSLNNLS